MAIFGWLILAVITFGVSATTILIGFAMMSLKGKPDGEFWVFFGAACALSYLTYSTFPFTITVTP